jgi:hypothetical protein
MFSIGVECRLYFVLQFLMYKSLQFLLHFYLPFIASGHMLEQKNGMREVG